jgi:hypothetical protein
MKILNKRYNMHWNFKLLRVKILQQLDQKLKVKVQILMITRKGMK